MKKADIGVIGLAVMGENLALNIESKGFTVAVYNRTTDRVKGFVEGRGKNLDLLAAYTLEDFVSCLSSPRKIIMMVRSGDPVDSLIAQLLPLSDKGDLLIDGGNSHFPDTQRRMELVESHGLLYIGTGISGGEEGALKGPSIMPGGSEGAWPYVRDILTSISAHVDGQPCCDWIGDGGAGHFVKMVHNGIEHGDMQLICETYQLMRDGLSMSNQEMHSVFSSWNKTELDSYLISITADILAFKDDQGNYPLDVILDSAGQKGTGKWTAIAALQRGVPLPLIGEAVFARCLSSLRPSRQKAADLYGKSVLPINAGSQDFLDDLRHALYCAKIISYAQGFQLMHAAAGEYGWKLDYGKIATLWRGGCIIRSAFLGRIKEAFDADPDLENLMLDRYFADILQKGIPSLRRVCAAAATCGVPAPTLYSALAYFDGYTCRYLPANLLQAQRDYFGAHTYKRIDCDESQSFHTDWTGLGGSTVSGNYKV